MTYIELSNPTKYKAHYNTKIKASSLVNLIGITINQPSEGGEIRVIYNGLAYTENFGVPEGEEIEILLDLTPGYTVNRFTLNGKNIINGYKTIANKDLIIEATVAVQQYVIQLANDEHSRINAICNGRDNYVNFNAFYNDTIKLDADTITEGYEIKSITVNNIEVDNGYTFKAVENVTIRAVSGKKILTIRINSIQNGVINVLYNGNTYTSGDILEVEYGDNILINVEPNIGYTLNDILINNTISSSNSYIVKSDIQISADISKTEYIVRIIQPEKATIKVQEGTKTNTIDFKVVYGTNILILVEVEDTENYYVEKILVNNTEVKNNSYYEVTSTITITANIAEIVHIREFSIKLNQSKYATITATNGESTYTGSFLAQEGSTIDLLCRTTIENYAEITSFTVDSTNYTIDNTNEISAQLPSITQGHIVSCSSKLKDINMNLSIINGEIISVIINDIVQEKSSSYTIHYQDKISVEIKPYEDYELESYTEIEGMTVSGNTFTFESYNSGYNDFSLNFICKENIVDIDLTIIQTIGGTISVNGSTENTVIPHGTNFIISITPYEGYSLNYIDINGTKYYAGDTIPSSQLIAKTEDITITANFILMRTVKLNQNNHATLSIQGYTPQSDGSYKIPNNTTVTVIAIPEDGYEVTGIEKK